MYPATWLDRDHPGPLDMVVAGFVLVVVAVLLCNVVECDSYYW
jgi:hypothetical protein